MTGREDRDRERRELRSRLLWFRAEHPDADIETELVVAEEEMAVCRVTLRTAAAGSSTAHGSALRPEDGSDYVEIAEDRSLLRALAAIGFGAAAGVESGPEEKSYAPPIDLVSARSLLREEAQESDETEYSEPPERRPEREERPRPPEADGQESDGADVSWNKFWAWARPRGYTSANDLNELLGVDNVLAYTPREVRQMLIKYEMDNPPGGPDE